jgi:V8-like Glu-specific endopeptidase
MEKSDGPLWVSKPALPIEGGMSGSPILSETGNAIGIVAASVMENEKDAATDEFSASNPRLMRDLPLWLLRTQTIRKQ